jgi:transcriptional regulator with XRE-family HTH domain
MAASENVIIDVVSPAQVRAARGLIGWTQQDLADASGIPKRTIARIELGGAPQRRTILAVQEALEKAGVSFIASNGGGPGVRLREAQPPA